MTEAAERATASDKTALDGGTRLLRTSLLEPPPTRAATPSTGVEPSRDTGRIIVPEPDLLPAATPRVAVRLEEVGKIYPNGKHALMDIDLVVPEGDFVFLVGPSGAGKSTLIKLLVHDEESTSGIIHVAGYDLTHLGRGDIPRLRRQIGIVFQDFRLLPRKTVRENVAFALQVTGTPRRQIRATVDRLLALVGLTAQADQRPSQLSGGEQQRTAIARAMVHDPRLIIADEPTGNLDPLISWEIIQLLLRINELGTTVLMATHNAEVVTALRKRVVALESGRIVRDEVGGYHRDYH
jgi:cell division transport system ATP-binding protein